MPALGTILIIIYGVDGTIINRILSNRFMVGIGLISYSLYIWHQPLFAFSRIYFIDEPEPSFFAILIFICFILSYLTWKFIEIPFRKPNIVNKKIIFIIFTTLSIVFIVYGFYLDRSYGVPSRVFDSSIQRQHHHQTKHWIPMYPGL